MLSQFVNKKIVYSTTIRNQNMTILKPILTLTLGSVICVHALTDFADLVETFKKVWLALASPHSEILWLELTIAIGFQYVNDSLLEVANCFLAAHLHI